MSEEPKIWLERIQKSTEFFEKWEKRFKCHKMQSYYDGIQWQEQANYDPYVVNLVYSTIEIKKPSLIFSEPVYSVVPRPWKQDWDPELAFEEAHLNEDTLNTFVQDEDMEMADEIEMSLIDWFFYFGIVEVGYSANWALNPNANKPIVESDYEQNIDFSKVKASEEPKQIPVKERVFVKRIPAHRFRVGGNESHSLKRCNWCGYYEFIRYEDILANKDFFKNTENLKTVSARTSDTSDENTSTYGIMKPYEYGDMMKVWKIWDLRKKEMFMIDEMSGTEIYRIKFKRLPLFDLRTSKRRLGWYPIPPASQWKSPQDEINETREQNRTNRRRTRRMWQTMKDNVDQDNKDKLMSGPDGTLIETQGKDRIEPIQNPPIDASLTISLQTSFDDFNKVSHTTSEMRGKSDRETATSASISNARAEVGESYQRSQVAKWLTRIGKEILLTIRDRFSTDFWIKSNLDSEDSYDEEAALRNTFQRINANNLGKSKFDVRIAVESLSPVTNAQEKVKLLEFLALLNQYQVLALHPLIIRELAYRVGYRNEKVIRALMQTAKLSLVGRIAEGMQNLQGPGSDVSNISQRTVEQMTPPDQAEIENQLNAQGVPVQ